MYVLSIFRQYNVCFAAPALILVSRCRPLSDCVCVLVQVRYQQELERQLEEQEMNKQKAYEEFLKEKLMIDEIVRKIYEEDVRWARVVGTPKWGYQT